MTVGESHAGRQRVASPSSAARVDGRARCWGRERSCALLIEFYGPSRIVGSGRTALVADSTLRPSRVRPVRSRSPARPGPFCPAQRPRSAPLGRLFGLFTAVAPACGCMTSLPASSPHGEMDLYTRRTCVSFPSISIGEYSRSHMRHISPYKLRQCLRTPRAS